MNKKPILFTDFIPGVLMGQCLQIYDEAQAQRWQAIFGHDVDAQDSGAAQAASIAIVGMMRAYLNVVSPRPPGNVHAKQKFTIHELPKLGETLRISVKCESKEERRSRKYLQLRVSGIEDKQQRPLFDGLLTLIWAS